MSMIMAEPINIERIRRHANTRRALRFRRPRLEALSAGVWSTGSPISLLGSPHHFARSANDPRPYYLGETADSALATSLAAHSMQVRPLPPP